jgi:succinate-acetate transporter protein
MAVGNTFGATALSSYGGFWIAYGILLTPNWNIIGSGGPYDVAGKAAGDPHMANSAVGFFLTGWFIFTTILLLCTFRSTIMFFMLFFTLDLAFLMLACGEYAANNGAAHSATTLTKAGGGFGMLAAFLAWYNAFAGIADTRYVTVPLLPFLDQCIASHKTQPFDVPFGRPHLLDLASRSSFVIPRENMGSDGAGLWFITPHLWALHCAEMPSASHERHQNLQKSGPMLCPDSLLRHVPATLLPLIANWMGTISLTSDSSFSNSFFLIPVFHFPWSEKGRENRAAAKADTHTD